MATLQQLEQALVNADKAADVNAARALAQEIRRMRGGRSQTQEAQSLPGVLSDAQLASAKDVAKQLGAIGVETAFGIPGMAGDVGTMYAPEQEQKVAGYARRWFGPVGEKAVHAFATPGRIVGKALQQLPTTQELIASADIQLPEPQTPAGQFTRTWAPFATAAIPFAPKVVRAAMPSRAPAKKLGVTPGAFRTVARSYEADTAAPNAPRNLGDEGMLMDVGPNTRQTARGVWAHPGSGRAFIDQSLASRGAGATTRASQTIDRTMGPRQNTVGHARALREARTAQGSPMYEEAFRSAGPVNTNAVLQRIDDMMPRPVGMASGKPLFPLNDIEHKLTRYRSMLASSGSQHIDGRVLQKVYQDLGDDIGAATRAGRNNEARQLAGVREELGRAIDDATGGQFSQANRQWADDSQLMEAYETGQSLLSSRISPDDLGELLRTAPPAARQQLVTGARNQIAEIIGTARNDALAARRLLDAGWNREKITMVLGKQRADELVRRLDLEKTYAETDRFVRGNSTTAPTLAGMADVGDATLNGAAYRDAFAAGGWKGPIRKKGWEIVEGLLGKVTRTSGDRKRVEIARLLSRTGGEAVRVTQVIEDYLKRSGVEPASARAKMVAALLGAGVAARSGNDR